MCTCPGHTARTQQGWDLNPGRAKPGGSWVWPASAEPPSRAWTCGVGWGGWILSKLLPHPVCSSRPGGLDHLMHGSDWLLMTSLEVWAKPTGPQFLVVKPGPGVLGAGSAGIPLCPRFLCVCARVHECACVLTHICTRTPRVSTREHFLGACSPARGPRECLWAAASQGGGGRGRLTLPRAPN